MKKILLLIGFAIIALTGYSRVPYLDSIDVSLITSTDSVYFIPLSRANFGSDWGIEFEYSTLNASDATISVGISNFGNTFTPYEAMNAIVLNVATDTAAVNGAAPGISARVLQPATTATDASNTPLTFNYLAIKVAKGSVTSGKIYYIIRQK